MQYLVSIDRNSTAVHLTRNNCEGSSAVDEFEHDTLWNDCAEDGDIRSE
jgi:hypothetical protein